MPYIHVYAYKLKNYHHVDKRFFGHEAFCTRGCGTVTSYTAQQEQHGGRSSCDILQSAPRKITSKKKKCRGQWLYTSMPTKLTSEELRQYFHDRGVLRTQLGYTLQNVAELVSRACKKLDLLSGDLSKAKRSELEATLPAFLKEEYAAAFQVNTKGFLLRLETSNTVIAMGDLHGSFHTFWRHLLRLRASGIITSLRNLTLQPGFTLLFTGDIVDRGVYGVDIVLIVLRLIAANPSGTVVYNRGNHEDLRMARGFGFSEEIAIKFQDPMDRSALASLEEYKGIDVGQASTQLHTEYQFMKFWASCPCAVVIENPETGDRVWFSHGGVPLATTNIVDKACPATELSVAETFACLWFDFLSGPGLWDKGVIQGRKQIKPRHAMAFMESNRLSFLIRGHQDNYSNAYLLSTCIASRYVHGSRFDLTGDYDTHPLIRINQEGTEQVEGPLATIEFGGSSWKQAPAWATPQGTHQVWPILTISTCTDFNKTLMKDGLVVITYEDVPVIRMGEQKFSSNAGVEAA